MLFLAAAAVALVTAPAHAHSLLLDSSPAAGAVLGTSPSTVTLTFNNRIEKSLSRLRLVADGGRAQDLAIVPGAPLERVTATLPSLGSGAYRIDWQVLSTDGHVVRGRLLFRVGR